MVIGWGCVGNNKARPWKLGEVTLGAFCHGDLVVRHSDPLYPLGRRMSGDSIGNVRLVLGDELVQHLLVESAQYVLLHLDKFAVPLLVVLSDMFPMAELVCPVHLNPKKISLKRLERPIVTKDLRI